jgi:hypothetical protein
VRKTLFLAAALCLLFHHHQWCYSPESGLGLPYGFCDRYITTWVISPTSNLVLVILIQPPETSSDEATITSSSKAGETQVRNMATKFYLRTSFHACRVLLHAVNLRHGTDGFTSPPKEGALRILSPLKSIVLSRVWTREPWVQWKVH